MANYRRTSLTEQDLAEIWEYIAADNQRAATRVLERLDAESSRLASHPGLGRGRPELGADIKSYPVGSYLILYRPDRGGIQVVRYVHGARDLPSIVDVTDDKENES